MESDPNLDILRIGELLKADFGFVQTMTPHSSSILLGILRAAFLWLVVETAGRRELRS
jgi:hypothetical protein